MNKRKIKNSRLALVIGTIVCVILIVFMALLERFASDSEIQIGSSVISSSSFNGVISSLTTAVCIIMVCVDYKKGSVIAAILLTTQMLMAMRVVLVEHDLYSMPGVLNAFIILIVIFVLRSFFNHREKESMTDYLTDTFNLRGLMTTLNMIKAKQPYCLFYVDLDDFKYINENLGHECGDQVLKIITSRLRTIWGKKSIIGRVSGDEFVIVVPGTPDIDEYAKQLRKAINEKIIVVNSNRKEIECLVTACIGISQYPEDNTDVSLLITYTDMALREAKKQGKNRYFRFDRSIEERIIKEAELEKLIRESLEKDYFYLVYQPQYVTENKTLRGFETLIRLKTPDGRSISPGEFIPVAEKSDLILEIDSYVLERAMREFGETIKSAGNSVMLSINVSAKNICLRGFAESVLETAEKTGFPCECLEIEITEYCLAKALDIAKENIEKLKAKGIEIALDDFGTGYASLSYLSQLSIDLLKIDKSFIDNLGKDVKSNEFVSAVISIGHLHGAHVISEGVETEEQLALLKEHGCDYIQGFIWGKPLAYEDAVSLAKNQ